MANKPSQFEKLEKQFRKNPESRLFFPLAEAYRNEGEHEQAIETYRQGLEHHPNYISARVGLSRALISVGKLDEARGELETVIGAVADNLMAQKLLAEIYQSQGNYQAALERYRDIQLFNPNDEEAESKIVELNKKLATGPTLDQKDQGAETAIAAEADETLVFVEGSEETVSDRTALIETTPTYTPVKQATLAKPEISDQKKDSKVRERTKAESDAYKSAEQSVAAILETKKTAPPVKKGPSLHPKSAPEMVSWTIPEEAEEIVETDAGKPSDITFDEQSPDYILDDDSRTAPPADEIAVFDWESRPEDQEKDVGETAELQDKNQQDDELFFDLGDAPDDAAPPTAPFDVIDDNVDDREFALETKTMAELYEQQGHFRDALNIYKKLLTANPVNQVFQAKVRDLENKISVTTAKPVIPAPTDAPPAVPTRKMTSGFSSNQHNVVTTLEHMLEAVEKIRQDRGLAS